jgi:hypothetical protein
VSEPRWIPVGEWLPKDGHNYPTVWGFDGNSVFLCEFHGSYGFYSYGASCDTEGESSTTLENITHWAEVIEPPPPPPPEATP